MGERLFLHALVHPSHAAAPISSVKLVASLEEVRKTSGMK
jgi:hypothetical protein